MMMLFVATPRPPTVTMAVEAAAMAWRLTPEAAAVVAAVVVAVDAAAEVVADAPAVEVADVEPVADEPSEVTEASVAPAEAPVAAVPAPPVKKPVMGTAASARAAAAAERTMPVVAAVPAMVAKGLRAGVSASA